MTGAYSSDVNDLAEPFRSALAGLLTEAGGRVRIGNGCRSTQRQFELRGINGCRGREYDPNCKGNPETARPGRSNHEKCLAADLTGDIALAHRLAPKYKLHFPVQGENWHIEYAGPVGQGHPLGGSTGTASPTSPALGIVGAPAGVSSAVGALTDPHTWLRVFYVVAGLAALTAGALIVGADVITS